MYSCRLSPYIRPLSTARAGPYTLHKQRKLQIVQAVEDPKKRGLVQHMLRQGRHGPIGLAADRDGQAAQIVGPMLAQLTLNLWSVLGFGTSLKAR